jgi:hypothetical protein
VYVLRNIDACSRNYYCSGKAINNIYSKCASVALVIQHTKRMRRVLLSFVACLVLPYFAALSYKEYEFRKKVMEFKICAQSSLRILSTIFRILRRIQRDIFTNMLQSLCKVRFYKNLDFIDRFSKNIQI